MSNYGTDLTQGSVTKSLLKFSLPFLGSSLLETLYSTVDTIIVGQFVGSAGLAAVNNATYITNAMCNIGMGAGVGATVIVSQYLGAKRHEELSKATGTALTLSFIAGIIFTILVGAFCGTVLDWINIPPESYTEARNYLLIRAAGLLFCYLYYTLSAVMRGSGDSKMPMYFTGVASVVNTLLDLLFVAVFHWGAGGAALATVFSQFCTLVCAVVYLKRKDGFFFDFKLASFKIDWELAKKTLKVGVPGSIQFVFIDMSFVFVNGMINSYGVIAASAAAVGSKVVNLGQVGLSALSTGVQTMAAQNIGAGKTDRASQVIRVGVRISFVMMTCIFILIQLFPEPLVRVFNSDTSAMAESVKALRYISIMYFSACFMFIYVSIASAVGFASFSMLCYILDGVVVRISLAVLLGNVVGMGLTGIYLAMGLAPSLPAVISAIYFYSGKWKKRNLL